MSEETYRWLNNFCLIGFTEKRDNAWHYRANEQGAEPNHYPFAIPIEDVLRRLFYWKPVEGTFETSYRVGNQKVHLRDKERKTIVRPAHTFGDTDSGAVLGAATTGYQIHDYETWLLRNVAKLLDSDLDIGSAGLLKGGAVAWVQVEMPETIKTPEDVEFRPFLSAATSIDQSISSTYIAGAQLIRCDNTLSAALGEKGAMKFKVKHTRNSLLRIEDARAAMQLVYDVADDFTAQVAALCATTVAKAQWERFLDATVPVEGKAGRGLTMADNKRQIMNMLWNSDSRVEPWKGTAFGVIQAVNTYTHHEATVRNVSRVERNMLRVVTGGVDKLDFETLATLNKVLVPA